MKRTRNSGAGDWCRLVKRKMASVVNFGNRNFFNRILLNRFQQSYSRWVSTGKKIQKESRMTVTQEKINDVTDFAKPLENKNWVSFGYDYANEKLDRFKMHSLTFFFAITVVWGGFFLAYMPDYEHRNWAKREAFIRLHERESLGLEPIDPNYVDPEKVVLPSDEELGNFEIVI